MDNWIHINKVSFPIKDLIVSLTQVLSNHHENTYPSTHHLMIMHNNRSVQSTCTHLVAQSMSTRTKWTNEITIDGVGTYPQPSKPRNKKQGSIEIEQANRNEDRTTRNVFYFSFVEISLWSLCMLHFDVLRRCLSDLRLGLKKDTYLQPKMSNAIGDFSLKSV